jgi:hypothetical protein
MTPSSVQVLILDAAYPSREGNMRQTRDATGYVWTGRGRRRGNQQNDEKQHNERQIQKKNELDSTLSALISPAREWITNESAMPCLLSLLVRQLKRNVDRLSRLHALSGRFNAVRHGASGFAMRTSTGLHPERNSLSCRGKGKARAIYLTTEMILLLIILHRCH